MNVKGVALTLMVVVLTDACRSTDKEAPIGRRYEHGAYILCEGNYGWGEGSIYYYDTSRLALNEEDAYKLANGFTAGNVVQSMTLSGETVYLVVNNSNKIEALDLHSLKRQAVNTTLTSPRYAAVLPGQKIAVTDLYANRLSVLTLPGLETQTTIKVSGWSEQMQLSAGILYATQRRPSQSAQGELNEQILHLDATTLQILDSTKLNGEGAQELVLGSSPHFYTSLEKDFALQQKPSILRFDPLAKTVLHIAAYEGYTQQPSRLRYEAGWLFFLQGDRMCAWNKLDSSLHSWQPFGQGANLTSLCILQKNDNTVRLLVGDAKNYTSKGEIKEIRVDLITNSYTELRSTQVGIIPGETYVF